MALALLTATILALVGFVATAIQGLRLSSELPLVLQEAARVLVRHHVGWAIPTVLLSLFAQSMVIFYFIGTGRLVKDEVAAWPEERRRLILAALRRFKARTSPPATFSLVSAIGVFVLGGAAHTRSLPSWTHLAAAVLAIVCHAWALVAETRAFAENHRLMGDPAGFAPLTPPSPRAGGRGN
jgi:hypothetical protein